MIKEALVLKIVFKIDNFYLKTQNYAATCS